MKTDDLIMILSQSPQPKKPLSFGVALVALSSAIAVFTALVLGLRPDLTVASADVTALHKTVLLTAVVWSAGVLLRHSSRPFPQMDVSRFLLWLPVTLFLGSIAFELMTYPVSRIAESFSKPNFPECLLFVTLYGTVGSLFLIWLMQAYAPADSKKAGTAIGLAAAGAGALGYSIHCPIDSPLFVAVAYGLPITMIAVVARAVAPRFIRW